MILDGFFVVCIELSRYLNVLNYVYNILYVFKVLFCIFVSKLKFVFYGKVSSLVIYFFKINDIINLIVV